MKNNSIMSLNLYREYDTWLFDDESNSITREPFILGASEIITRFAKPDVKKCTIFFSHNEFPESKKLRLLGEDMNGGTYICENKELEKPMYCWLCPVTRIYMGGIPEDIYFTVKS